MTPDARYLRALYMREWRKKHPEKQREYTAKHWEKKAKKLAEERAAATYAAAQR